MLCVWLKRRLRLSAINSKIDKKKKEKKKEKEKKGKKKKAWFRKYFSEKALAFVNISAKKVRGFVNLS